MLSFETEFRLAGHEVGLPNSVLDGFFCLLNKN